VSRLGVPVAGAGRIAYAGRAVGLRLAPRSSPPQGTLGQFKRGPPGPPLLPEGRFRWGSPLRRTAYVAPR